MTIASINQEVIACRKCPRLVAWREKVAAEKRRAYRDQTYWGKPVPSFGDPKARLVIVGLAPAAHGANRTGRMFTGDRSGDFLYAGLHRAGFANQATSVHFGDGLALTDAYISAPCKCAPPDNLPLKEELAACAPYLARELKVLKPRLILALGGIAWDAVLDFWSGQGVVIPRPKPRFGHGAEASLPGAVPLLASYHVSQQNTQTGRLTPAMLDDVLLRAKALLQGPQR